MVLLTLWFARICSSEASGCVNRVTTVPPVLAVFLQDPGASEDAGEGVVVTGGDWIKEVVVAACAPEVEAKEGLGRGGDLFINDIHPQGIGIGTVCKPWPDREKARGCEQVRIVQ